MIVWSNARAASQVRASETSAPATRQAIQTTTARSRASCAGWPSGTAPDQRVRATPENIRRNHAFPIHDPFDLGSCRVDPPDAPADLAAAAANAGRIFCSTNGCASFLELDPAASLATCPICGFTRRVN